MVSPSDHGVSRVVHHKDYYLRGGDITVLVENHLFKFHSYFFDRESLFFRQKFTEIGGECGSSDSNAYTLEDVKSEDFARFLWVFYNPKYSLYDAPLDVWLSVLKLANRWSFDNVKELSVRELEKIDIEPVEKIAIYHDHTISRLYLLPSYIAVCKRDKPLSFTEGMKLGMETVLRIADARERVRQRASESGIRTPTFEDFEDSEVEGLVREVFSLGSRPTSPTPANGPSLANGSSQAPSVFKLNDPPKANGASASRSNGVSAADVAAKNVVNNMRSFGAALETQASAVTAPGRTSTAAPTAPAPAPAPTPAPTPAPAATATATRPVTTPTPPPPPPATDKPKEKAVPEPTNGSANPVSSVNLLGGLGEPPLRAEGEAGCQNSDINATMTVPTPVVPSDVKIQDVNDVDDNDTEKDDGPSKEGDLIFSDNEGRGGKQGGAGRGNGKKPNNRNQRRK